jgi:hypothetical protein
MPDYGRFDAVIARRVARAVPILPGRERYFYLLEKPERR